MRSRALAALLLGTTLAACRERKRVEPIHVTVDTIPVSQVGDAGGAAPSAATPPSAREGTAITTTNGAVTMAVADDRVVVHLSDSLVRAVKASMDSSGARDSGSFGGMIARIAQTAVSSALSKPLAYPLDEIEDARYDASYDGGAIRLRFRGGEKRVIESTKVDDRPLLASFAPEDARRFVAAVREAKARQARARRPR